VSEIQLNAEQREVLKKAVEEGVNSKYRVQSETDLQKAIADRMKDEVQVPPKLFRRLVTLAYKANGDEVNAETEELLDLAEEVGVYSHNPDEDPG